MGTRSIGTAALEYITTIVFAYYKQDKAQLLLAQRISQNIDGEENNGA